MDLNDIFANHVERNIANDPTVYFRELRGELDAIRKYRDRELLELLQNAVDRADRSVVAWFDQRAGRLVMGNDGKGVSVRMQGGNPEPASDFQGLCSLHTSRKKAWQAIGNKGVGFKSVFGTTDRVEVWSRDPTLGWWGFRLRSPFQPQHAHGPHSATMAERVGMAKGAPSFYFPELLTERNDIVDRAWVNEHQLVTLIVLDDVREPEELADRFDAFARQNIYFVAARFTEKTALRVHVLGPEGAPVCPPKPVDVPADMASWPPTGTYPVQTQRIRELADREGLEFNWDGENPVPPHLRIAFPDNTPDSQTEKTPRDASGSGRYWCFLPTQETCPFPFHLHGDFQLGDDRRGLQRGSAYNLHLLEQVPQLLETAFRECLIDRDDCWRFLRPSAEWDDPLVRAMSKHFFGDDHRFGQLAALAFGTHQDGAEPQPRSIEYFSSFWDTVADWEWRIEKPYKRRDARINYFAGRLLARLRDQQVCCMPIAIEPEPKGELTGAPIPRDQGQLFFRELDRSGQVRGANAPVPAFLRDECNVQITWHLPAVAHDHYYKQHLGWKSYQWRELASELRRRLQRDFTQKDTRDPTGDAVLSAWKQAISYTTAEDLDELVAFVITSITSQPSLQDTPGARLEVWADTSRETRDRARTLRDLALVPLPVGDSAWLPACRCSTTASPLIAGAADETTWGVVSLDRLPPGEATDRALRSLGVWPTVPLLLEDRSARFPIDLTQLGPPAVQALLAELGRHLELVGAALELPLHASIEETPWLPVGKERHAPRDVWQLRKGDNRPYGSVPVLRHRTDPGRERVLSALGVFPIVQRRGDRDEQDGGVQARQSQKAVAALQRLQTLHPEPALAERSVMRRVTMRLAEWVDEDDIGGMPILAERRSDHAIQWVRLPLGARHEPAVWRSLRQHERWRWKFPDLFFACLEDEARLGKQTGFHPFAPTVTAHQHPDDAALGPDPWMRNQLQRALPVIAAVAEAKRYGKDGVFELENVVARWEQARVLRGANVYLRLALGDGSTEATDGLWVEGSDRPRLGDVYFSEDTKADGVTAVMHDVPDNPTESMTWGREDLHRYLPKFARWFARAVFEHPQAQGDFSIVLEWYAASLTPALGGPEQFQRQLRETFGLDNDALAEIRDRCHFMDPSDRQRIASAILDTLGDFGEIDPDFDPLSSTLDQRCFTRVHRADLTCQQVQAALVARVPTSWPTRFDTRIYNRARWHRDKPVLAQRVLPLAVVMRGVDKWTDELVVQLHEAWEALEPNDSWLDLVNGDPWEVLKVSEHFHGLVDREPPTDPRVAAVLRRRPWKKPVPPPKGVRLRGPALKTRAGHTTVTSKSKRESADRAMRERGENAELATARREAAALWGRTDIRDAIDKERARVGDTRPFDWDDHDEAALAELLRISGPKGQDCGYDVVSLDAEGQIRRIEVKSAQGGGSTATIHLSDNEIRRALESLDQFELVVYVGFTDAWDLSEQLREILRDDHLLKARAILFGVERTHALAPDGYVLLLPLESSPDP